MKNIPIPGQMEFRKKITAQTESLFRIMSWKAFHYLNHLIESEIEENLKNDENSMLTIGGRSLFYGNTEKPERYGFKTERKPPYIKELQPFFDDVLKMIKNLEFRQAQNEFLNELKDDIKSLENEKRVILEADKSNNFYLIGKPQYTKLLEKDIKKEYKKAKPAEVNLVNQKTAEIAKGLKLEDRMPMHTTTQCYQTLKDHKKEFKSEMPMRLIAPAKIYLGKVSKPKLDKINSKIREIKGVNQWRNTASVIEWFTNLDNKENLKFFKFDIQSFYPKITKKLFLKAIKFAQEMVYISENDIKIFMQCRETFLFHEGAAWKKSKTNFDVTMGSFDGAEICELIGLYMLDKITKGKNPIFPIGDVGLYRDDGLAVVRTKGRAGGLLDKVRKKVVQAFKDEELEITSVGGMTITDFLDVELNLETNEYSPWRKPNDFPVYINAKSNHPPNIIKEIPKMIEKRLTNLSSNEKVFEEKKPIYVTALKNSGHDSTLKYNPDHKKNTPIHLAAGKIHQENGNTPSHLAAGKGHEEIGNNKKAKRKRKREIMYYNPPYSLNVKTKIASIFLRLVRQHFHKDHKLYPIFGGKSKIKVSYCTMNNMKKHINKHNNKISSNTDRNDPNKRMCNCRQKNECPLDGKCLTESIVYEAKVSCETTNVVKTYIGLTEPTFKARWDKHKYTFNHPNASSTTLSSYFWKCKNGNKGPKINWSIKAKAHAFSSGGKRCDLCITEKVHILLADPKNSLNQRSEIMEKCRHKRKYMLVSTKTLPKYFSTQFQIEVQRS